MDKRQVFLQKFVSVSSRIVMLVCGIVSILYLTNRLGLTVYGEYASLIAIVTLIRFPIESFFQSAIPLMVVEKEPNRLGAAILHALWVFGTTLTILALLIGYFAPEILRISTPSMWYAIALDICFGLLANGYLNILTGKNHLIATSVIFGIYWLVRLGFSISFVECGFGPTGAISSIPLASLSQVLFCVIVDKAETIRSSRIQWSELWHKSKIYSASMILERMLYSCDLVAMKLFNASPLTIGFYATGLSLSQAFLAIARSLSPIQLQLLVHYRSSNASEKFDSLAQSMLIGNIRMIGLAILGLPFLPFVIQFLIGKDVTSTHAVFVLIIAAASCQLLFSAGRILNVAVGDPTQMKMLLSVFLILQFLGFGIASQLGGSLGLSEAELAIFQAKLCAGVSIACNLGLALFALSGGLGKSNQGFPWNTCIRILAIAATLGALGVAGLNAGLSVFVLLPLSVLGYGIALWLSGDLGLMDPAYSAGSER